MSLLATILGSAALALVFTTCGEAYALDLVVVNRSPTDATLEIFAGSEDEPADEPFVHFSRVVGADARADLSLERPGPGGWTILMNGSASTHSGEWPSDNPTIDLTIMIEADGSVSVEDT